MRKLSYAVMSIAMATLTFLGSCRKPDNIITPTEPEKPATITFGASLDDGSKTYINGKQILWSSGDKIKVNGVSCDLKSGAGTKSGTFQGAVDESNTYLAAHYGNNSNVTFLENNTKLQFTIPENTYYIETSDNTNLNGAIPIAAYSTGGSTNLEFKSMVNLVKVVLRTTDEVTVSNVKLTNLNGGKLWGNFNASGNPLTPEAATGGSNKTEASGTISIPQNGSKTIYFVIPVSPVSSDNYMMIEVTGDKKDGYQAFQLTDQHIANHIYTINIDLGHRFNVGSGKEAKYVKFAPGNLYTSIANWPQTSGWGSSYGFFNGQTVLGGLNSGFDVLSTWNHFYHAATMYYSIGEKPENKDLSGFTCPITSLVTAVYMNTQFTNPSITVNDDSGWYALSYVEWINLLTNQKRRCLAKAGNVYGWLICPPDYPSTLITTGFLKNYKLPNEVAETNTPLSYDNMDLDDEATNGKTYWQNMERLGVLFLPFAGYRENGLATVGVGSSLVFILADIQQKEQTSDGIPLCMGIKIGNGSYEEMNALYDIVHYPYPFYNNYKFAGSLRLVKDVN